MEFTDIVLIVTIVLAIVLGLLYMWNRKNYKKVIEAEEMINANKQVASIFVIDKKHAKPTEKDLNKAIYDQLDSMAKMRKLCMIKAKVGPQIATLLCEKNVYDVLTPKKTVKVELSGLYIVSVVGVDLKNKKKKTIKERLSLFVKANPKEEAKKIVK